MLIFPCTIQSAGTIYSANELNNSSNPFSNDKILCVRFCTVWLILKLSTRDHHENNLEECQGMGKQGNNMILARAVVMVTIPWTYDI